MECISGLDRSSLVFDSVVLLTLFLLLERCCCHNAIAVEYLFLLGVITVKQLLLPTCLLLPRL
jgi:hypothetical protein